MGALVFFISVNFTGIAQGGAVVNGHMSIGPFQLFPICELARKEIDFELAKKGFAVKSHCEEQKIEVAP